MLDCLVPDASPEQPYGLMDDTERKMFVETIIELTELYARLLRSDAVQLVPSGTGPQSNSGLLAAYAGNDVPLDLITPFGTLRLPKTTPAFIARLNIQPYSGAPLPGMDEYDILELLAYSTDGFWIPLPRPSLLPAERQLQPDECVTEWRRVTGLLKS